MRRYLVVANQTLGGAAGPGSGPSAFTDTGGDQYAYYVGSDYAVHLWLYNWSAGTWNNQDLGGSVG